MKQVDVLIIGAGAAGLWCAIHAAKRGRKVLLIEQSHKAGRKILMSGGGRCNFTNLGVSPDRYLSENPHFCKSALSQYTQWDFIDWVESHQIAYHEKTQGQLFCDDKARVLVDALWQELAEAGSTCLFKTTATDITPLPDQTGFQLKLNGQPVHCQHLVVATGGLSIPSMGSSPFAYRLAEQFDIPVVPTRAGLVPFTVDSADKAEIAPLSGIAFPCTLSHSRQSFSDDLLLTHRGISGPAALQLSSYWSGGESININCFPTQDLSQLLQTARQETPTQQLKTLLSKHLPERLVVQRTPTPLLNTRLADVSSAQIAELVLCWSQWSLIPSGTEGYRTAEVTLGGVSTDALSSKTMAVRKMPNLSFIGEAVDVTGWLGGYNFQWAWSSAWVAAQAF